MDLVIRGGTIVHSDCRQIADIGVSEEKIVQIGGQMASRNEIDASDRFVIPGGVDMHVHFSPAIGEEGKYRWADDFASGSRAAAAGGITTVGNMSFPFPGERLLHALARTDSEAAQTAVVDYLLHPVFSNLSADSLSDVVSVSEYGCSSLKLFMAANNVESQPELVIQVMERAAHSGLLTMVHCEDGAIIRHVSKRLIAEGKSDSSHYGASHPTYSESASVARAVALARAANAPIYLVHISSLEALTEAHNARRIGLPVFVETRPDYLIFDEGFLALPEGPLFTGSPPLRPRPDVDALWTGIAAGEIDTCCSDHAPWMKAEKLDPSKDIMTFPGGVPAIETMLSVVFSEGVVQGRISMERFVDITSTKAAMLFGLYPDKGALSVGSDADIVIWDPGLERRPGVDRSFSNADYSPFEGLELRGGPTRTISRGETVFLEGEVLGQPGRGRRLRPSNTGEVAQRWFRET